MAPINLDILQKQNTELCPWYRIYVNGIIETADKIYINSLFACITVFVMLYKMLHRTGNVGIFILSHFQTFEPDNSTFSKITYLRNFCRSHC
jgi:hypothetical protein